MPGRCLVRRDVLTDRTGKVTRLAWRLTWVFPSHNPSGGGRPRSGGLSWSLRPRGAQSEPGPLPVCDPQIGVSP